MYISKYKNVTYNDVKISDICDIQSIKIPFMPSRQINKIDLATDGEKLNGFKKNSYEIELSLLIDCNNESEYIQKVNQLRYVFEVNELKKFSLGNGKFILAMTEDQIDAPEKIAPYSSKLNIKLYCPSPYFYSNEFDLFENTGKELLFKNDGDLPIKPFISIGFSKNCHFVQLNNRKNGNKMLIGNYPKLELETIAKDTTVLIDECISTGLWNTSQSSIDSNRGCNGSIGICDGGGGFCLSTTGGNSDIWNGAQLRINLPEAIDEFEVKIEFTFVSSGINGDPSMDQLNKETVLENKSKTYYEVTNSILNVRSGPGTNYKKLGSIKKGFCIYNAVEVNNKWIQWQWKDKYGDTNLYSSLKYLEKKTETNEVTTTKENWKTTQATPIRSKPNITGSQLAMIPTDTVIRIITTVEGYDEGRQYVRLAIPYNSIDGYVCLGNLERCKNTTISYPYDEDKIYADNKTGLFEVYGMTSTGEKMWKMQMVDDNKYFEFNRHECSVGKNKLMYEAGTVQPTPKSTTKVNSDGTVTVTNYPSGQYGNWNNFKGTWLIRRSKKNDKYVWDSELMNIENGVVIRRHKVDGVYYKDASTDKLSNIVLYLGTTDNIETCCDMSLDSLIVNKLNDINQTEKNITFFKEGDILDIDFENRNVYLNGLEANNLVDIGSEYFDIDKGETVIDLFSDDESLVAGAVINKKWIGGE